MNPMLIGALAGAAVSLIVPIIQVWAKFSINRASATKIASDSGHTEATTAEVFSRLAAEWTVRADLRVDKLESRIEVLVVAIEVLTEAVDRVAPLLEASVAQGTPEAAENVIALRLANRTARRVAL